MADAAHREYVTLPIAAKRLGVHEKTVRRLIASGHLTGYRIGPKLLRVDAAELDKMRVVPTVGRFRG